MRVGSGPSFLHRLVPDLPAVTAVLPAPVQPLRLPRRFAPDRNQGATCVDYRTEGHMLWLQQKAARAPVWAFLIATVLGAWTGAATLGTQDSHFTANGRPVFLCGISYYDGCAAPTELVQADLDEFSARGINWVRVWATWDKFADISAVDNEGQPREPHLGNLKHLVAAAYARGIVVDVTLRRGGRILTHQAHVTAVSTPARELLPYRNVHLDLGNERNIRDARFVSFQECAELAAAVRAVDPNRLVTASHGGDIGREDLRAYLDQAQVDFVALHRPGNPASPAATEQATRQLLS